MSRRPHFVLIAPSESPRVEGFQLALVRLGLAQADLVSYENLLSNPNCLTQALRADSIVRVESPCRNYLVEKKILQLGIEQSSRENFHWIEHEKLESSQFDKGRILAPRQWYLGYRALLRTIALQVEDFGSACSFLNHPDDIALMFDKPHCQNVFRQAGIQVPRQLGLVDSFEHLDSLMKANGSSRVFLKLAHGSSASGIIAYRRNVQGTKHQALTTIEPISSCQDIRLYNTRKIQKIDSVMEISTLVDELCRHRCFAEHWLPKAQLEGHAFDLRVLTIGAVAHHVVVRQSKSPFTNLHLLNKRASVELLKSQMDSDVFSAAMIVCQEAAACFPRSLYAGVDLLIKSGMRGHAIAEINAFGDQLNGVEHRGKDTYTSELESLMHGHSLAPILEGVSIKA
jgi:hypothetical protein